LRVCKTLNSGSIPLAASSISAGRGHFLLGRGAVQVERKSTDSALTNPCLPRRPAARSRGVRGRPAVGDPGAAGVGATGALPPAPVPDSGAADVFAGALVAVGRPGDPRGTRRVGRPLRMPQPRRWRLSVPAAAPASPGARCGAADRTNGGPGGGGGPVCRSPGGGGRGGTRWCGVA